MSEPAQHSSRAADASPAETPLFRQEVLSERGTRWLGSVILKPRRAHIVCAWVAIGAATALILLIFLGSYTRKITVNGWLVPRQGLARIVAPQAGIVTRLHVTEGTAVRRGQPLVTMSAEVQNESLAGARAEIVRRLIDRRDSMTDSRDIQARMLFQQKADLERRVTTLDSQLHYADRELAFQAERVRFARDIVARETEMRSQGLIALPRLEQSRHDALEQAARLEALNRGREVVASDLDKARVEVRESPLNARVKVAGLDRDIGSLEQELAEAETRRTIVITAPEDGVVTAIQADPGGGLPPSAPLMTIVPDGSILEAHLYGPSKAIGFIKGGQKVRLRYDAFPYQKFGFHEGMVAEVSRAAAGAGELPRQTPAPGAIDAPLYRITIHLPTQYMRAYGQQMALRPHMLLEADVQVESRRLIEWLIEPLTSITGR